MYAVDLITILCIQFSVLSTRDSKYSKSYKTKFKQIRTNTYLLIHREQHDILIVTSRFYKHNNRNKLVDFQIKINV